MTVSLNGNQLDAMRHYEGPMMVLAGPGSGKTTVITYRVKNLIESCHIPPNKILVISFTKASCLEMEGRFLSICNARGVMFSTFHALFFKIIRQHYGYIINDIIDEDEKRETLKKIIAHKKISVHDIEELVSNIILEFSVIASSLLDIKYYSPINMPYDEFVDVYNLYSAYKKGSNKIDFDDMLIKCYNLFMADQQVLEFWRRKFSFVLIDEFQDINRVQYECIMLLVKKHKNIFIVGDDDQSIYKFRGAGPEFLLKFPDAFETLKKVVLNINYRSTDKIIDICNQVIIKNKFRYDKKITGTQKSGGSQVILRSKDINSEALNIGTKIQLLNKKISYNEIAVIYRNNIQARSFVDVFLHLNIPFQIKDKAPSIYEHWVFKDIKAYLKSALAPDNDRYVERVINKPSRYISRIIIAAAKKKEGSLLNNLLHSKEAKAYQKNKIEEFKFYLNAISKRTPYEAVKYIREAAGYDNYLKQYSEYRKMSPKGLIEIMGELQESAKNFQSIDGYLGHVEMVLEEIKESYEQPAKNGEAANGVTLSTLHSVKGLEYNTVFIASCVDGLIPYEKAKTEPEIEEERRLFYVGLTRAKENLFISIVDQRYEKDVGYSVFLEGLYNPKRKTLKI
ncbi:MAG: ATP-dependent helicase [Clostridiales bacterium]|nr:ATP-dependent helicase [Clostridiales bacterium]